MPLKKQGGPHTMYGPFFGEFMGTLVLILLGDGAVANVLLKKSKGENSGWIVIATAWGMAVVAGIFTAIAFGSPGGHINPAITLTVAVLSGEWSNVGLFWTAQILGAFAGASLVWLVYLPHWKVTPDAEAKLAVFCTAPAIRNLPANLITEIIATTCLIVVGFSFGSPAVSSTGLPMAFRLVSVRGCGESWCGPSAWVSADPLDTRSTPPPATLARAPPTLSCPSATRGVQIGDARSYRSSARLSPAASALPLSS
jgi:glycerol uptake facilitator-like aquaporin